MADVEGGGFCADGVGEDKLSTGIVYFGVLGLCLVGEFQVEFVGGGVGEQAAVCLVGFLGDGIAAAFGGNVSGDGGGFTVGIGEGNGNFMGANACRGVKIHIFDNAFAPLMVGDGGFGDVFRVVIRAAPFQSNKPQANFLRHKGGRVINAVYHLTGAETKRVWG